MSKSQAQFLENLTVDVLARTLWGESRGQPKGGMEAVANVVLNRVAVARERGGFWWGNDIISVCQKPFQFSCWNADDPNRPKLIAVDDSNIHFATALRIARRAVNGRLSDNTNGATHYHAKYVSPVWAKNKKPSAVIGDHIFYQLSEG
ncbi:MAG TPA: cell wall hydrolase [Alphaproteobacteria bacterium]